MLRIWTIESLKRNLRNRFFLKEKHKKNVEEAWSIRIRILLMDKRTRS